MRLATMLLALSVLGCQGTAMDSGELTEERRAEIEAEVREVVDALWAGAGAADMDAVDAVWSREDGLCLFQRSISSCASVRESYRADWGSEGEDRTARQEFDGQETQVTVLTPTTAVAATKTDENRAYRPNGDVSRGRYANFFVLVLEDGKWKIHSAQQAGWPIEDEGEA